MGLPEPRSRRKRAAAFSCRYLVEGSCGIPFYCEELLRNLDHHRVLVFHPLECEEKTNVTWNNLFSKCHRLALSPVPCREEASMAVSMVCLPQGRRVWAGQECQTRHPRS